MSGAGYDAVVDIDDEVSRPGYPLRTNNLVCLASYLAIQEAIIEPEASTSVSCRPNKPLRSPLPNTLLRV